MKVLRIKEELMDVEEATVKTNLFEIDAFIKDVLVEHFYSVDVITPDLFEEEEVFVTKVNDMISDFAYLCDVLPNGTVYFINHTTSMLNINYLQTNAFNLGIKENP